MRTSVRLFALVLSVAVITLMFASCDGAAGYNSSGLEGSLFEKAVGAMDKNETSPEGNTRTSEKTYSADGFFSDDRSLFTDSTESLSVAFIGGSLTEGTITYDEDNSPHSSNIWTEAVLSYFSKTFPNRCIRAYNAGICATTSEFGALRLGRCVLEYSPDVIFVEYAVNDSGFTRESAQAYMENIILQSKKLDKEPVIIFVYNPWPADKNSAEYAAWKSGVDWKNEIADYYGIGTVNVYDYLYDSYKSSGYGSFFSYLGKFYYLATASDGSSAYDVHPNNAGYELYGEAVVSALESNPEEFFVRMTEREEGFENNLYSEINSLKFNHIAPDSGRLSYKGEWKYYYSEGRFDCYTTSLGNSALIPASSYFEPNNEDGIMQTLDGKAEVSFDSSAEGIYVQMPYAAAGNTAEVFADGKLMGEISCHLNFYGYTGIDYVALPNDGKTHHIVIRTGSVSEKYGVFRFGYIIEAARPTK